MENKISQKDYIMDELYEEKTQELKTCHINARTRPMFKEMLNTLGNVVVVGNSRLQYGDAIYKLDISEFDSLFNRWITACSEKNIMRKTLSSNCTKKLEWSKELSDVERAFKSMEVLKEIL